MTAASYRVMASEIRDLVPLLLHPQAATDLSLLADRYDRLADWLESAPPGTLPDMPLGLKRQAD